MQTKAPRIWVIKAHWEQRQQQCAKAPNTTRDEIRIMSKPAAQRAEQQAAQRAEQQAEQQAGQRADKNAQCRRATHTMTQQEMHTTRLMCIRVLSQLWVPAHTPIHTRIQTQL